MKSSSSSPTGGDQHSKNERLVQETSKLRSLMVELNSARARSETALLTGGLASEKSKVEELEKTIGERLIAITQMYEAETLSGVEKSAFWNHTVPLLREFVDRSNQGKLVSPLVARRRTLEASMSVLYHVKGTEQMDVLTGLLKTFSDSIALSAGEITRSAYSGSTAGSPPDGDLQSYRGIGAMAAQGQVAVLRAMRDRQASSSSGLPIGISMEQLSMLAGHLTTVLSTIPALAHTEKISATVVLDALDLISQCVPLTETIIDLVEGLSDESASIWHAVKKCAVNLSNILVFGKVDLARILSGATQACMAKAVEFLALAHYRAVTFIIANNESAAAAAAVKGSDRKPSWNWMHCDFPGCPGRLVGSFMFLFSQHKGPRGGMDDAVSYKWDLLGLFKRFLLLHGQNCVGELSDNLDDILDEKGLMGITTGVSQDVCDMSARDYLRAMILSVQSDVLLVLRSRLSIQQTAKAVNLFCGYLLDDTRSFASRTASISLLLSLADQLINKPSNDSKQSEQSSNGSQQGTPTAAAASAPDRRGKPFTDILMQLSITVTVSFERLTGEIAQLIDAMVLAGEGIYLVDEENVARRSEIPPILERWAERARHTVNSVWAISKVTRLMAPQCDWSTCALPKEEIAVAMNVGCSTTGPLPVIPLTTIVTGVGQLRELARALISLSKPIQWSLANKCSPSIARSRECLDLLDRYLVGGMKMCHLVAVATSVQHLATSMSLHRRKPGADSLLKMGDEKVFTAEGMFGMMVQSSNAEEQSLLDAFGGVFQHLSEASFTDLFAFRFSWLLRVVSVNNIALVLTQQFMSQAHTSPAFTEILVALSVHRIEDIFASNDKEPEATVKRGVPRRWFNPKYQVVDRAIDNQDGSVVARPDGPVGQTRLDRFVASQEPFGGLLGGDVVSQPCELAYQGGNDPDDPYIQCVKFYGMRENCDGMPNACVTFDSGSVLLRLYKWVMKCVAHFSASGGPTMAPQIVDVVTECLQLAQSTLAGEPNNVIGIVKTAFRAITKGGNLYDIPELHELVDPIIDYVTQLTAIPETSLPEWSRSALLEIALSIPVDFNAYLVPRLNKLIPILTKALEHDYNRLDVTGSTKSPHGPELTVQALTFLDHCLELHHDISHPALIAEANLSTSAWRGIGGLSQSSILTALMRLTVPPSGEVVHTQHHSQTMAIRAFKAFGKLGTRSHILSLADAVTSEMRPQVPLAEVDGDEPDLEQQFVILTGRGDGASEISVPMGGAYEVALGLLRTYSVQVKKWMRSDGTPLTTIFEEAVPPPRRKLTLMVLLCQAMAVNLDVFKPAGTVVLSDRQVTRCMEGLVLSVVVCNTCSLSEETRESAEVCLQAAITAITDRGVQQARQLLSALLALADSHPAFDKITEVISDCIWSMVDHDAATKSMVLNTLLDRIVSCMACSKKCMAGKIVLKALKEVNEGITDDVVVKAMEAALDLNANAVRGMGGSVEWLDARELGESIVDACLDRVGEESEALVEVMVSSLLTPCSEDPLAEAALAKYAVKVGRDLSDVLAGSDRLAEVFSDSPQDDEQAILQGLCAVLACEKPPFVKMLMKWIPSSFLDVLRKLDNAHFPATSGQLEGAMETKARATPVFDDLERTHVMVLAIRASKLLIVNAGLKDFVNHSGLCSLDSTLQSAVPLVPEASSKTQFRPHRCCLREWLVVWLLRRLLVTEHPNTPVIDAAFYALRVVSELASTSLSTLLSRSVLNPFLRSLVDMLKVQLQQRWKNPAMVTKQFCRVVAVVMNGQEVDAQVSAWARETLLGRLDVICGSITRTVGGTLGSDASAAPGGGTWLFRGPSITEATANAAAGGTSLACQSGLCRADLLECAVLLQALSVVVNPKDEVQVTSTITKILPVVIRLLSSGLAHMTNQESLLFDPFSQVLLDLFNHWAGPASRYIVRIILSSQSRTVSPQLVPEDSPGEKPLSSSASALISYIEALLAKAYAKPLRWEALIENLTLCVPSVVASSLMSSGVPQGCSTVKALTPLQLSVATSAVKLAAGLSSAKDDFLASNYKCGDGSSLISILLNLGRIGDARSEQTAHIPFTSTLVNSTVTKDLVACYTSFLGPSGVPRGDPMRIDVHLQLCSLLSIQSKVWDTSPLSSAWCDPTEWSLEEKVKLVEECLRCFEDGNTRVNYTLELMNSIISLITVDVLEAIDVEELVTKLFKGDQARSESLKMAAVRMGLSFLSLAGSSGSQSINVESLRTTLLKTCLDDLQSSRAVTAAQWSFSAIIELLDQCEQAESAVACRTVFDAIRNHLLNSTASSESTLKAQLPLLLNQPLDRFLRSLPRFLSSSEEPHSPDSKDLPAGWRKDVLELVSDADNTSASSVFGWKAVMACKEHFTEFAQDLLQPGLCAMWRFGSVLEFEPKKLSDHSLNCRRFSVDIADCLLGMLIETDMAIGDDSALSYLAEFYFQMAISTANSTSAFEDPLSEYSIARASPDHIVTTQRKTGMVSAYPDCPLGAVCENPTQPGGNPAMPPMTSAPHLLGTATHLGASTSQITNTCVQRFAEINGSPFKVGGVTLDTPMSRLAAQTLVMKTFNTTTNGGPADGGSTNAAGLSYREELNRYNRLLITSIRLVSVMSPGAAKDSSKLVDFCHQCLSMALITTERSIATELASFLRIIIPRMPCPLSPEAVLERCRRGDVPRGSPSAGHHSYQSIVFDEQSIDAESLVLFYMTLADGIASALAVLAKHKSKGVSAYKPSSISGSTSQRYCVTPTAGMKAFEALVTSVEPEVAAAWLECFRKGLRRAAKAGVFELVTVIAPKAIHQLLLQEAKDRLSVQLGGMMVMDDSPDDLDMGIDPSELVHSYAGSGWLAQIEALPNALARAIRLYSMVLLGLPRAPITAISRAPPPPPPTTGPPSHVPTPEHHEFRALLVFTLEVLSPLVTLAQDAQGANGSVVNVLQSYHILPSSASHSYTMQTYGVPAVVHPLVVVPLLVFCSQCFKRCIMGEPFSTEDPFVLSDEASSDGLSKLGKWLRDTRPGAFIGLWETHREEAVLEDGLDSLLCIARAADGMQTLRSCDQVTSERLYNFIPQSGLPTPATTGLVSGRNGEPSARGMWPLASRSLLYRLIITELVCPLCEYLRHTVGPGDLEIDAAEMAVSCLLIGCTSCDQDVRKICVLSIYDNFMPEAAKSRIDDRLAWALSRINWECISDRYFIPVLLDLVLIPCDLLKPEDPGDSDSTMWSSEAIGEVVKKMEDPRERLMLVHEAYNGSVDVAHEVWVQVFSQLASNRAVRACQYLLKEVTLIGRQSALNPSVPQTLLAGLNECEGCDGIDPIILVQGACDHRCWSLASDALQQMAVGNDDVTAMEAWWAILDLCRLTGDPETELWARRAMGVEDAVLQADTLLLQGHWVDAQSMVESWLSQQQQYPGQTRVDDETVKAATTAWVACTRELSWWSVNGRGEESCIFGDRPLLELEMSSRIQDWRTIQDSVSKYDWCSYPQMKLCSAYFAQSQYDNLAGPEGQKRKSELLLDVEQTSQRVWNQLLNMWISKVGGCLSACSSRTIAPTMPFSIGLDQSKDLFLRLQQFIELQEASHMLEQLRNVIAMSLPHMTSTGVQAKAGSSKICLVPDLSGELQIWRNRVPSRAEPMSVWGEIFTWRQFAFHLAKRLCRDVGPSEANLPPDVASVRGNQGLQPVHSSYVQDSAWSNIRMSQAARRLGLPLVAHHFLEAYAIDRRSETYPGSQDERVWSVIEGTKLAITSGDTDEQRRTLAAMNSASWIDTLGMKQVSHIVCLEGNLHHGLGAGASAEQLYSTALALDPTSTDAWENLANLLWLREGDPLARAAAVTAALQAVGLDTSLGYMSIPRILRDLMDRSEDDPVVDAFVNYATEVPLAVWLRWLPMLLELLVHGSEAEAGCCAKKLLLALAEEYPQRVYYRAAALSAQTADLDDPKSARAHAVCQEIIQIVERIAPECIEFSEALLECMAPHPVEQAAAEAAEVLSAMRRRPTSPLPSTDKLVTLAKAAGVTLEGTDLATFERLESFCTEILAKCDQHQQEDRHSISQFEALRTSHLRPNLEVPWLTMCQNRALLSGPGMALTESRAFLSMSGVLRNVEYVTPAGSGRSPLSPKVGQITIIASNGRRYYWLARTDRRGGGGGGQGSLAPRLSGGPGQFVGALNGFLQKSNNPKVYSPKLARLHCVDVIPLPSKDCWLEESTCATGWYTSIQQSLVEIVDIDSLIAQCSRRDSSTMQGARSYTLITSQSSVAPSELPAISATVLKECIVRGCRAAYGLAGGASHAAASRLSAELASQLGLVSVIGFILGTDPMRCHPDECVFSTTLPGSMPVSSVKSWEIGSGLHPIPFRFTRGLCELLGDRNWSIVMPAVMVAMAEALVDYKQVFLDLVRLELRSQLTSSTSASPRSLSNTDLTNEIERRIGLVGQRLDFIAQPGGDIRTYAHHVTELIERARSGDDIAAVASYDWLPWL